MISQVPSWEDALYCSYNSSRDRLLAGPNAGQGEGYKYTIPALGSQYFISMPTPCLAGSPSTLAYNDYNRKCCQKLAVVSVEEDDSLDTVLEGMQIACTILTVALIVFWLLVSEIDNISITTKKF